MKTENGQKQFRALNSLDNEGLILSLVKGGSVATRMQSARDRAFPSGAARVQAPLRRGLIGTISPAMHATCLLACIDCILVLVMDNLGMLLLYARPCMWIYMDITFDSLFVPNSTK